MTPLTLLGIDIGGTFTDFVYLHNGIITIHKLPTTPADPSQALLAGVAELGMPDLLIHGTTIATNALLERRGAPTALLTTAGFADILALGRGNRPTLYDLNVQRDPPIVPAEWRLEVHERVAADGTVLHPLNEQQVAHIIDQLATTDVEAVAVCFLHSYRTPAHEEQVATMLRAVRHPDGHARFFVCHSAAVIPEYREYERTSTTVVNAYVAPVLDRYLSQIEHKLHTHNNQQQDYALHLHIMASDGGSMTTRAARHLAARTTLSGPAGGVVGARAVAQQAGFTRIITFDMGGTSTDVALCDNALPQTTESQVGGYPVRFPALAIHTVGAGGGSLARIDAGGAMRVGPQSAGASPGPACYGQGTMPTVTDANLLLGRLREDHFLGGTMRLDSARATDALAPLMRDTGMDITSVALGIVRIANAAMERALRTISVERGIDPRDFTLVAFGGAGPLHAAYLADALGMKHVLVPRYPGVLSALGMITADMSRDSLHFLAQPLATLTPDVLLRHMTRLAQQAQAEFAADAGAGSSHQSLRATFTLDLRYAGQSHEITTPLMVWEGMQPHMPHIAEVAQRFHLLHEQYSGHAMLDHPIEAVVLRLKCTMPQGYRLADIAPADTPGMGGSTIPLNQRATPIATVQAALAAESPQQMPTALYERATLRRGDVIDAPAIIVQFDTTCVVPPSWQARVDAYENVILQRV